MMRKKVVFTRDPARASFFFPQDTLRIPFLKSTGLYPPFMAYTVPMGGAKGICLKIYILDM